MPKFSQTCPNFHKLAQNVVIQLLPTVFGYDLQRTVFTYISANVGRHFLRSNTVGYHFAQIFREFAQTLSDFVKIFRHLAQIFRDFPEISGILPGFSTNQNFWGCACTSSTPPPTPLGKTLQCKRGPA